MYISVVVDSPASGGINRPGSRRMRARRWRGEGRLEAGSQSARGAGGAAGSGGGGAASRKRRPAGREAKEAVGRRDRNEGTTEETVGAASSLYPGQAARERLPRSGGAKPEEAAHRHLFYTKSIGTTPHLRPTNIFHSHHTNYYCTSRTCWNSMKIKNIMQLYLLLKLY